MLLDLEILWNRLSGWSQATFGLDCERGPIGPLKHLKQEVKEALEAWSYVVETPPPEFQDEMADCLLLVFDAARRGGMTYRQLELRANQKLEMNKLRAWKKPKKDEAIHHEE